MTTENYINQVEAYVKDLRATIADLQRDVEQLTASNAEADVTIGALRAEVARLRGDYDAYEWTHEERPCRCSVEHRPHCHRCGGTGIYKSARLRRIDDATTTHQAATGDSATGANHEAASA